MELTFKVCRTEDVFTLMRNIRHSSTKSKHFSTKLWSCDCWISCNDELQPTNLQDYFDRLEHKSDWQFYNHSKRHQSADHFQSFKDYFEKKGVTLQIMNLVSSPSGQVQEIFDVETRKILDWMMDDMRVNFRLMKDLAIHLHQPPTTTVEQMYPICWENEREWCGE